MTGAIPNMSSYSATQFPELLLYLPVDSLKPDAAKARKVLDQCEVAVNSEPRERKCFSQFSRHDSRKQEIQQKLHQYKQISIQKNGFPCIEYSVHQL